MHRVRVTLFVDREFDRLTPLYACNGFAFLVAAFDHSDITQVNGATGNIGDDGVAEFRDRFEFVQRAHQESLVAFLQATSRQIDVFSPDAFRDLFYADAELREFLLIDLDLDFVLESAADLDGGGAFLGLQVGLDTILCETPQRFQTRFRAVRRICRLLVQEPQPDYRFRRGIKTQQ